VPPSVRADPRRAQPKASTESRCDRAPVRCTPLAITQNNHSQGVLIGRSGLAANIPNGGTARVLLGPACRSVLRRTEYGRAGRSTQIRGPGRWPEPVRWMSPSWPPVARSFRHPANSPAGSGQVREPWRHRSFPTGAPAHSRALAPRPASPSRVASPCGPHDGRGCQRHGNPEDPVCGMRVCRCVGVDILGPRRNCPGWIAHFWSGRIDTSDDTWRGKHSRFLGLS
jgi:hypothetical protein